MVYFIGMSKYKNNISTGEGVVLKIIKNGIWVSKRGNVPSVDASL